jgi:hypothetical protein
MLVCMRTVATLVRTRALAEFVRTRPKGGQCDGADANGEDKMSLSFLFYIFFLEKPCMPTRGTCLLGWSAAQLAASRITDADAEWTSVVEH